MQLITSPWFLSWDRCAKLPCTLQSEVAARRGALLRYMLFLRLTPLLPNTFINVASPIVGVPLHVFALGACGGCMPVFVLHQHSSVVRMACCMCTAVTASNPHHRHYPQPLPHIPGYSATDISIAPQLPTVEPSPHCTLCPFIIASALYLLLIETPILHSAIHTPTVHDIILQHIRTLRSHAAGVRAQQLCGVQRGRAPGGAAQPGGPG